MLHQHFNERQTTGAGIIRCGGIFRQLRPAMLDSLAFCMFKGIPFLSFSSTNNLFAKGSPETVRLLLEHPRGYRDWVGRNPYYANWTPLHVACCRKKTGGWEIFLFFFFLFVFVLFLFLFVMFCVKKAKYYH